MILILAFHNCLVSLSLSPKPFQSQKFLPVRLDHLVMPYFWGHCLAITILTLPIYSSCQFSYHIWNASKKLLFTLKISPAFKLSRCWIISGLILNQLKNCVQRMLSSYFVGFLSGYCKAPRLWEFTESCWLWKGGQTPPARKDILRKIQALAVQRGIDIEWLSKHDLNVLSDDASHQVDYTFIP